MSDDDEQFDVVATILVGAIIVLFIWVPIAIGASIIQAIFDTPTFTESMFYWHLYGAILVLYLIALYYLLVLRPQNNMIKQSLISEEEEKEALKNYNDKKAKKEGYTNYKEYRSAMIEEARQKKSEELRVLEKEALKRELELARQREQELEKKRKLAAKKAAKTRKRNKILKEREKVAKPRKDAAFRSDVFQTGHGRIGMSKRDGVWNSSQGVCCKCLEREIESNPEPEKPPWSTGHGSESYNIYLNDKKAYEEDNLFNSYTDEVSFYWTIHPSLQVVLMCNDCALNNGLIEEEQESGELGRSRRISAQVKREVLERDAGKCVQCGRDEDLHFDHDLPFSKGGSNEAENIQLLCKICNLSKGNKIM